MAKIPRLTGDIGGGGTVPAGGGVPPLAGVTAPLAAAGDVVEAGYKVAAHAERAEAQRKQQFEEAKQAILNEAEAGRLAGDYQEELVVAMDTAKTEFQANPKVAAEHVLTLGREYIQGITEAASNPAAGLAAVQRANSHLDSAVAHMHSWAQLQLSQRAKADLDEQVNKFTAVAETLPTVEALNKHIRSADTHLGPALASALGEAGAKRLSDAKGEAAEAWAQFQMTASPTGPFVVAHALDNATGPGNPFGQYTSGARRTALRKAAADASEGLAAIREVETIKQNIDHGGKVAQAYLTGDMKAFASIVVAERRAIKNQREALEAKISFDESELKVLGIDPAGKTDVAIRGLIDDREKFIDALYRSNLRQVARTAQDDPASVGGFVVRMNKALAAKGGKDLRQIAEQQTNLALLHAEGRISVGTASTYFTTMALAMQAASDNQEELSGPNTSKYYHEPREAGIAELNRQFGTGWDNAVGAMADAPRAPGRAWDVFRGRGEYANASAEDKIGARIDYEAAFNAAIIAGEKVDKKAAKRMALRALSRRLHKPIPGGE